MSNVVRKKKDTPEAREYWAFVEKTAAEVATWPEWMTNGPVSRRYDVSDKPMTLREGLQELTEQLREQGKMVVLLDAILAQTADADAEQSRLARIGGLVEGFIATEPQLGIERVEYIEGTRYHAGTTLRERGTAHITLLDALEALKQKLESFT